jgi:hypothetical protein
MIVTSSSIRAISFKNLPNLITMMNRKSGQSFITPITVNQWEGDVGLLIKQINLNHLGLMNMQKIRE